VNVHCNNFIKEKSGTYNSFAKISNFSLQSLSLQLFWKTCPMPMRKLSNEELQRKTIEEFRQAGKYPVMVVLDNVRSLNNIGSVFRTCDAFLIEGICLCGITATPPHREISRTALGATESVSWQYFTSAAEAVRVLKATGYTVFAIEQTIQSIPLYSIDIRLNKKYALVFGHEINGVEQEVVNVCDGAIEIPQYGTKHSLNIAVSAGMVLWEFFRHYQATGQPADSKHRIPQ
jgi:tRNA G18 (ribose-2'-O)-methylase SpoU